MKYLMLSSLALVVALSACSPDVSYEEHVSRGQSYMDEKDWRSAVIEFKNGIKKFPQKAEIRFLLGSAYLHTFSSDAAIKEFKKSIALGGDANKVLVQLGRAYALKNSSDKIISEIVINDDLSKEELANVHALRSEAFIQKKAPGSALAELEKAKELDENNIYVRLAWAKYESLYGTVENQLKWLSPLYDLNVADAWSQKGDIENKRLNFIDAEKAYTKSINIRKFVHKDYLSRALVRVALKKYDEAKSDLRMLKSAGFILPMVLHTEGVIAFQQADYELAQSKAKEVLGKFKEFPPSLYLLGISQFKVDKFLPAISSLEPYLETNPDNKQARYILAVSLMKAKKYSKAIEELKILNKDNIDDQRIASLLSRAYVLNGQIDEGIFLIKKAIKSDPKNADNQLFLGTVLLKDNKDVKAGRDALNKAVGIDPDLFKANLNLYISYMRSKQYEKAKQVANNMIENKPNESLPYNLLAYIFISNKNEEKAIEILESTLKKIPADTITSMSLANINIRNNNYQAAKDIYLKALDKHPSDSKILLRLAVVEAKLGNNEGKIDYLKKAVNQNPSELSPKLILANVYLRNKEYKKSLNVLRDLSENDKQNVDVMFINAQSKMGLKEYNYSMLLWKKIVAQNPKSASAHFYMGQNYGHLNQIEKMKQEFNKTLTLQPDHFAATLFLTRIALIEDNMDEFKKHLDRMNKLYPDNANVKYLNAQLKNKEKNYDSAILDLENLLKDVSSSEVVVELARNKWASGDVDGAIIGLELWIEKNSKDTKALMLLGQYYTSQNRFAAADEIYGRVDELVPNNAIVLNNRAWLYLENNNIESGIKLARKALKLEPNSPFIKDTLSMLLFKNNNLKEALLYSSQAAESQPNFVDIQINYAKILLANKNKALARKVLNRANGVNKTFEQRKKINQMMSEI